MNIESVNKPLAGKQDMPTLSTAIVTAYLLTGSITVAEDSVTEAIRHWDPSGPPASLLQAVAEAASGHEGVASDSWELPAGLHGVMQLSLDQRRCFVLRILLAFPKRRCERLLRLSEHEVDQYTFEALRRLGAGGPDDSGDRTPLMNSLEGSVHTRRHQWVLATSWDRLLVDGARRKSDATGIWDKR